MGYSVLGAVNNPLHHFFSFGLYESELGQSERPQSESFSIPPAVVDLNTHVLTQMEGTTVSLAVMLLLVSSCLIQLAHEHTCSWGDSLVFSANESLLRGERIGGSVLLSFQLLILIVPW